MLDLLQWFMGEIDEITGYWANLNHPYIEVEDTALAMIRFKNGGLGSIVDQPVAAPGIYTKVHIHGANGASVGVETDRGATFIAGVSEIADPPLNDLWTIPGEEHLPRRDSRRRTAPLSQGERDDPLSRAANSGFPASGARDRPPLVTAKTAASWWRCSRRSIARSVNAGRSAFRWNSHVPYKPDALAKE